MINQILIVALVLIGINGGDPSQEKLNGIQWTLTKAGGQEITSALAYFEIDADGRKFSGSTGCNRMFGTVALKDSKIQFRNIGSTKMKCVIEDGDVAETAFLAALKNAASYSKNGNELKITDDTGRTILEFKRLVKLPPVDADEQPNVLEGRKWMLESTSSFKSIVGEAFVRFDAKKKSVGGNSGCNVFGGDYSQDGNKIKIGDVISTMRACIEDDRSSIERELFEGLRTVDRYEIRGGKLFLYKGRSLLLTFR